MLAALFGEIGGSAWFDRLAGHEINKAIFDPLDLTYLCSAQAAAPAHKLNS